MFTVVKRPFYVLSNKLRRKRRPIELMKERWIADFSKPEKSCFDIKSEISYNAYLEKGLFSKGGRFSKTSALFLGLKKKNCMAWIETAHRVYVDHVIEARFRFDGFGGYCAAGIMFRVAGQGTYYLALISSKGYFRLDAVNNHVPTPLIGWTEAPGLNDNKANLKVIAQSDHLIFLINGKWIAEMYDDSIPGGHLGFALVSYDSDLVQEEYVCQSRLDFLSVDSRAAAVEAEYQKWNESAEVSAESRFRLAESLAALNCFDAAYKQILRAWKQREETAKSVTATYTETRTKSELFFAARMVSQMGRYTRAEEYLNVCLAADTGTPALYALLGHVRWNVPNYQAAADAWDKAFSLDGSNGLYAVRAADAFEQMGKKEEALQRRLDGAQCFMQQKDYAELGTLIPQLLAAGKVSAKTRTAYNHKLSADLQAALKRSPHNKELTAFAAAIKQLGFTAKTTAKAKTKAASPKKVTKTKKR